LPYSFFPRSPHGTHNSIFYIHDKQELEMNTLTGAFFVALTFLIVSLPVCLVLTRQLTLYELQKKQKILAAILILFIFNYFFLFVFSLKNQTLIFRIITYNLYIHLNIKYIFTVLLICMAGFVAGRHCLRIRYHGFMEGTTLAKKIAVIFCLWFGTCILCAITWLKKQFAQVEFEEILYYATTPLKGAHLNITGIVISDIILKSLFIALSIVVFLGSDITVQFQFRLNIAKLMTKLRRGAIPIFSGIFLAVSLFVTAKQLDVFRYLKRFVGSYSNFYETHYINPQDVTFSFPEKKKNLLVIIVESLETAYMNTSDGGAFSEDIIPHIRGLGEKNINFTHTQGIGGAKQLPGTGGTVAGIVSYFSGLPLTLPINGNSYGVYTDKFMPGAVCLGDILEQHGYRNYFILGSDSDFGGRDDYFYTHGKTTIWDYNYFKEAGSIPKDYLVWWGFEDRKLYQFAKEKLLDCAKTAPFFLTILTVDTHPVDGYLDTLAEERYNSQFKNVLYNMDKQLAEFIAWCQTQDFYRDTTIVILGDHLYQDVTVFPLAEKTENRYVFNIFINSELSGDFTKNRKFSHFDIFPTLLDSIGVTYNAKGLGLGRKMSAGEKTLLELNDEEDLNNALVTKSKLYEAFFEP
jgi:phosphoglycerol transferase